VSKLMYQKIGGWVGGRDRERERVRVSVPEWQTRWQSLGQTG
jgi:hypothetical protein